MLYLRNAPQILMGQLAYYFSMPIKNREKFPDLFPLDYFQRVFGLHS